MGACGVLILVDMFADFIENSPQHGPGFSIDHCKPPKKSGCPTCENYLYVCWKRRHAIMARSLSTGVLITVKNRIRSVTARIMIPMSDRDNKKVTNTTKGRTIRWPVALKLL
jgi:hypothetical protein